MGQLRLTAGVVPQGWELPFVTARHRLGRAVVLSFH